MKESRKNRYIVEVDEPKEGQIVSTGGIRENGKMCAQFRNPVPYEEPDCSLSDLTQAHRRKQRVKNGMKELAVDLAMDLAGMVWRDFGKPFLREKLHVVLENYFLRPHKTLKAYKVCSQGVSTSGGVDVEGKEVVPLENTNAVNKVIRFPKERAG